MIFIDAGAVVARLVARDHNHAIAVKFWNEISIAALTCCTSNLVIAEALTLVARRTSYEFAAQQAIELYSSRVLRIVRPTQTDEISAIPLFRKFADQKIGFVDCVSFAIMKRLRIDEVFGFDRHFITAGFQLKP